MLRALLRLVETREFEAKGETLDEVHAELARNRPEGFDLTKAPVAMGAGGGGITAVGVYERRDTVQEISAPTMPALEALVPDGWIMLWVVKE